MNPPTPPKDASARSPFAGCAILIAALVVMVFLIGFSVATLFRQSSAIEKFTAEKPVPIEVSSIENQEVALNSLAERLEAFRQQLLGNNETSLSLTAEELNLAIATYDPFKNLRGTFRVVSIEGDTLRIAVSFKLNGRPRLGRKGEPNWIASDTRYLNATLVARPQLLKHEIVLDVERIEVPGVTVPQGFIGLFSPYRIMECYLTDPVLGPAMAKFTRVEVKDGKIVLTRKPNEVPADHVSNAQVDSASSRLFTVLGIAAVIFLAFAGVIVLIGVRAKARKARENSPDA